MKNDYFSNLATEQVVTEVVNTKDLVEHPTLVGAARADQYDNDRGHEVGTSPRVKRLLQEFQQGVSLNGEVIPHLGYAAFNLRSALYIEVDWCQVRHHILAWRDEGPLAD